MAVVYYAYKSVVGWRLADLGGVGLGRLSYACLIARHILLTGWKSHRRTRGNMQVSNWHLDASVHSLDQRKWYNSLFGKTQSHITTKGVLQGGVSNSGYTTERTANFTIIVCKNVVNLRTEGLPAMWIALYLPPPNAYSFGSYYFQEGHSDWHEHLLNSSKCDSHESNRVLSSNMVFTPSPTIIT